MPSERRKGTCGHLPLNVRSKAGRMKSVNLGRMIRLAGEVFSARTDPDQLDVDEAVIERLQSLHPATLSEHVEGDGPVVWILLIPTTRETMDLFFDHKIGERELLDRTHPGEHVDALYLCSALVLPEFRGKGLAQQVSLAAIRAIRRDHAIRWLYVWPFSEGGDVLAKRIAEVVGLKLYVRKHPRVSTESA